MALIVVLGLAIPGQEQVHSFQRNSAVSSASGQSISLPTGPTVDKASAVQAQIRSQVEKISDITSEISAVMKRLKRWSLLISGERRKSEIKEYQELLQAFQESIGCVEQKTERQDEFAKPHTALRS